MSGDGSTGTPAAAAGSEGATAAEALGASAAEPLEVGSYCGHTCSVSQGLPSFTDSTVRHESHRGTEVAEGGCEGRDGPTDTCCIGAVEWSLERPRDSLTL